MRFGAHMRIGKGLKAAVSDAVMFGCETIQIFASNPNAWRSRRIEPDEALRFRELTAEHDIRPVTIHTQYLLNLASPDPDIHGKSTAALTDNLKRAELLNAEYVVTHIGSHKGSGFEQGAARVERAVSESLNQITADVVLLLENSAGSGDSVGANFNQLRYILDKLEGYSDRIGICLDTAHLWGAGYDLSSKEAVEKTFAEFDHAVGFRRLKLLHFNDTNVRLGSRTDRHANIGTGLIGKEGFDAIINHPQLKELPAIIETPARKPEDDIHDLTILKSLRQ